MLPVTTGKVNTHFILLICLYFASPFIPQPDAELPLDPIIKEPEAEMPKLEVKEDKETKPKVEKN